MLGLTGNKEPSMFKTIKKLWLGVGIWTAIVATNGMSAPFPAQVAVLGAIAALAIVTGLD